MIDYNNIQPMLIGRWEEILETYGITVGKWRGKNTINQPCPCCGGDDRAHWRQTEGRVSLFCRSCAADSMKSPEQVIMELCELSFTDLVSDLAQFANYQEPEQIKKAQNKVAAQEKRNYPVDHKQDHDKATAFLESCEMSDKFAILIRNGIQPVAELPSRGGYPIFEMRNETGGLVNLACLSEKGVSFIAGGHSYGAWFTIEKCDFREMDGVAWTKDPIKAIHHWYKTGQETRVTFHDFNTLWMANVGIINESDTILEEID